MVVFIHTPIFNDMGVLFHESILVVNGLSDTAPSPGLSATLSHGEEGTALRENRDSRIGVPFRPFLLERRVNSAIHCGPLKEICFLGEYPKGPTPARQICPIGVEAFPPLRCFSARRWLAAGRESASLAESPPTDICTPSSYGLGLGLRSRPSSNGRPCKDNFTAAPRGH